MDSAAALGWHVGPISVPACDWTIAPGWGMDLYTI